MSDWASLKVDPDTRHRLKMYCAKHELTYSEAIDELLEEVNR